MSDVAPPPSHRVSQLDRLLLRHSLRWRLPAIFGVVVVLVLASFLWATYREVERTLVAAAVSRAAASAQELAGTVSGQLAASLEAGRQSAAAPHFREFVQDPGPDTRAAVRTAVLAASQPGLRRFEIWDTSGAMLFELTTPPDSAGGLRAYPPGSAPTAEGLSPIRAAGQFPYYDLVSAIPADSSASAPPIGFIRRFGRFTQTGTTFQSLLGDDAVLKIGTHEANVWTDLNSRVDPPPVQVSGGLPGMHAAAGERWVGTEAAIAGSPLRVWVGYPRDVIIAPAQSFMRRMIAVGLVLAALGIVLVVLLGIRLTQPLRALSLAADRIAGGDYTRRVPDGGKDEIGRLRRAFNTMADRIEEVLGTLRATHERTQFTLAAARIGVWESHIASGRMSFSESMRLVHDFTDEAAPRSRAEFLALVHPDDRASVSEVLEGRYAPAGVFDVHYRALMRDGSTRFVEGKGRFQADETGQPESVVGVSIDMTEQRRLEGQLRQAQKMEAMGLLAGGVAHDFNNLLTAIVGHGSLLLEELQSPEDAALREEVLEMLRASESAAALTRQLLAFSRRQVAQPQVVSLNDVIDNTKKLLRRLIGADIEFSASLAPDLHAVRIDPGHVEQVIVNLAVNARDAMPDGGRLTITTSNIYLDEEYTRQRAGMQPGPYVVMSVNDTGTGMDAATQARLFEPFFTTKGPGQGTGLGLATVFGIVKQHGGEIFVYSEEGIGTTFKVYLPATRETAAATPARAPVRSVQGTNQTILIVEDSAPVRTIAETILQRAGYKVITASSGQEALALLENGHGRPDLVVTDVVMPGMTGLELSRQLEARYPGIRLIFTSGYAGDALGRHGIDASVITFLEKPYSPAELTSKVHESLTTGG